MKIKQHYYELRDRNKLRLTIRNYGRKRLRTSRRLNDVTNSKKSSIGLTRNNVKIHEMNVEVIERSEERSMTGSVSSNQNTKQIFVTGKNENKKNIREQKHEGIIGPCTVLLTDCLYKEKKKNDSWKIEEKHKSIRPCKVVLTDCLYKEGKKNEYPWSKPESIDETYKQVNKSENTSSKINYIYSQTSQGHCEVAPGMLEMSNVSGQFIHRDDSETNFKYRVSYQSQILLRTNAVSETIASSHHLSKNALRVSDSTGRSALNEKMHESPLRYVRTYHRISAWHINLKQSVWKWLLQRKGIFILLLFVCLCLFAVYYMPKTVKNEFLSAINMDNNVTKEDEEKSINDNFLYSKIATFEKRQTYQKEYLKNITLMLEDYRKQQDDFQKTLNNKNAEMINNMNISDLNNIVNNKLEMIRYEFEELRNLSKKVKSLTYYYAKIQVENILSDYFSSKILEKDLTENMSTICRAEDRAASNDNGNNWNAHISEKDVRKIVKEILQIYDADKTGQVDYALESAGGQIVSTQNTQGYNIKSQITRIFGFPLYHQNYNNYPHTVIQNNPMQPGNCWAFQNFPGYLLIRLQNIIYVTGFTLEHASRLIISTESMSSAPRKFNVWGLTDEDDPNPVMFGDYEFENSEDSLQYFPVQNTKIKKTYKLIELRVLSNHGHQQYTCLYKFRVHGSPATKLSIP